MADPTVGTVRGRLQLVIGDAAPILLTSIQLPVTILNGSDFATYSLKVDLADITETVRAIFEAAERRADKA